MRKYALREIQAEDRQPWISGRGNTFDSLDAAKSKAQRFANTWKNPVAIVTNKIASESVEICRIYPQEIEN